MAEPGSGGVQTLSKRKANLKKPMTGTSSTTGPKADLSEAEINQMIR
jgi:hypothetical protein